MDLYYTEIERSPSGRKKLIPTENLDPHTEGDALEMANMQANTKDTLPQVYFLKIMLGFSPLPSLTLTMLSVLIQRVHETNIQESLNLYNRKPNGNGMIFYSGEN